MAFREGLLRGAAGQPCLGNNEPKRGQNEPLPKLLPALELHVLQILPPLVLLCDGVCADQPAAELF
jgi:hypothetical protein